MRISEAPNWVVYGADGVSFFSHFFYLLLTLLLDFFFFFNFLLSFQISWMIQLNCTHFSPYFIRLCWYLFSPEPFLIPFGYADTFFLLNRFGYTVKHVFGFRNMSHPKVTDNMSKHLLSPILILTFINWILRIFCMHIVCGNCVFAARKEIAGCETTARY
jgi:hypothetical protein